MILTEKEARSLMDRVLSFSTADETRINIYGGRSGNTRFALNSITTSGYENTVTISVTSYFGKRHATAITTEIDDESLKEVVKKAEILARYSPEDPEYVPELGPQQYLEINSYFQQTANAKPSLRAEGVLSCIKPARERDLDSSGFFIHDQSFEAVGNNKGLFGYHKSTNSSFSATVRTPDGTGSGWASYEHRDIGKIDYEKISDTAISKAENSANPEPMDPGEYPVILEPQAVYDIILFSVYSMDARSADEGRSFFSRPGEANKI
ncbi:MAG: PmbA/TldA family metallopeptidase, partial [Fidelibacterota bacterium]